MRNICQQLKKAILDGRLKPDFKLPSTRALSQELGVSRNTLLSVYDTLLSEGFIKSHQGKGSFVADIQPIPQSQPVFESKHYTDRINPYRRNLSLQDILPQQKEADIDFRIGQPDTAAFPSSVWQQKIKKAQRALSHSTTHATSPQGDLFLREQVAHYLSGQRAVACQHQNILITAGAQQALNLLAQVLITPGKTKIAVESPSYPMASAVFSAFGASVIPIPVDQQGILVSDIPNDVDVVYVTPSHQFPLGITTSISRRSELLLFAQNHNVTVLEDDYDSDFRFHDRPVDALKVNDTQDNVVYIGTFSKCLLPEIRIGYLLMPEWIKQALVTARFLTDWYSPPVLQKALGFFIQDGDLQKHIRKMRALYHRKYKILINACEQHGRGTLTPLPIHTGLHVTVLLPTQYPAEIIAQETLKKGVSCCALSHFLKPDCHFENERNGLIFGLGKVDVDKIEQGIIRLTKIMSLFDTSSKG